MSTLTIGPAFQPVAVRRPVPRSQVRLTRRGRVVVLLASLVLAFAVGIMVAAGQSHRAATDGRLVDRAERRADGESAHGDLLGK